MSLLLAFICAVTAIILPRDIYAEYGETRVKITSEERELIENFQKYYKLKDIQKEEIDYNKFKEPSK